MTIRTGKGGRYRYYTCNNRVNEGATTCRGRNIPMALLDGLVVDEIERRVFAPERLNALLAALIDRSRNRSNNLALAAQEVQKKLRSTEQRIERLYDALAEGTVSDTDLFRRTLARLEQDREEQLTLISSFERRREIPSALLSKDNLASFATAASKRLRAEDAALRKGYVRQFVNRIEVGDDEVKIYGSKAALVNGLLNRKSRKALPVPRFDPNWWAQ